jgi:hypothetical protein
MIRYALRCDNEDEFEGWFDSIAAFDRQSDEGLLTCPVCGSGVVRKAPMAPAVSRQRAAPTPADIAAAVRNHIQANCTYVGENFAREARAAAEREALERPIWGEATPDEARALVEDGIAIAPLPAPFAPIPPKKLN